MSGFRWINVAFFVSCIALVVVAAGCGDSTPTTEETTTDSKLVEVPDVTGDIAEDAASKLEDKGFTVSFGEDPDDSSECTVREQDKTGEVEPGTEVHLTLECEEAEEGGSS